MEDAVETDPEDLSRRYAEGLVVLEKYKDQFERRLEALPTPMREHIVARRQEVDEGQAENWFDAIYLPYELVYAEAAATILEVIQDPWKVRIFSSAQSPRQMQQSFGYEKEDVRNAGKEVSKRAERFRFFDYSMEQLGEIWAYCALVYPDPHVQEEEDDQDDRYIPPMGGA